MSIKKKTPVFYTSFYLYPKQLSYFLFILKQIPTKWSTVSSDHSIVIFA